jgi:hypothetical protein
MDGADDDSDSDASDLTGEDPPSERSPAHEADDGDGEVDDTGFRKRSRKEQVARAVAAKAAQKATAAEERAALKVANGGGSRKKRRT